MWISALEIPGIEDDKADVKKLVQDHLSKKDIDKWLLVFDNADDIDMWVATLEELVPTSLERPHRLIDYLPQHERGCIIFTTRDKRIASKLALAQQKFEVPQMSDKVALDLFGKHLDSPVDNLQDAIVLLTKLTFLPLAIVQAAAYINENGITLAEYSSLLETKEEDVIDLLSEELESHGRYQQGMRNPVATTWLVSFDQIRRRYPLAAEYLSFMACMDPRGIPQSLLPPGPSRKKELESVGTLAAYSFISRRPIEGVLDRVLDLHRLVHLATRNWLRKESLLAQSAEKAIVRLEEVDGRWNEAEAVYDQILKTVRADHPATLTSIANLASTFWNQGRWDKAEKLEVQVMETYMTKLGADHPDTLTSIANLASTFWSQGRWDEAEKLEIQVMETYMMKLGADHPDTLTSIANLASTYRNQGRWGEAEKLEVQVMETYTMKMGVEHPDTLTSIANLALTYRNQGRWDEAEKLEVQVMETRTTKLGADHPDTLTSIANLASTCWKQGRWDEAEKLLIQLT
ncbi:hypothetical protein DV736_g4036, partial [Chaetothyriales sp. CBS 134916]